MGNATTVALVVGGLAVAGGVGYALYRRSKSDGESSAVARPASAAVAATSAKAGANGLIQRNGQVQPSSKLDKRLASYGATAVGALGIAAQVAAAAQQVQYRPGGVK